MTKDKRYTTPKGKPQADRETVERVIAENSIYSRAQAAILGKQREQVGYGLGKYPEPLTASTWSIKETIEHIAGEQVDTLHYLFMLAEQLEERIESLEEENARLKASLRFYAREEHYEPPFLYQGSDNIPVHDASIIDEDGGAIARQALQEVWEPPNEWAEIQAEQEQIAEAERDTFREANGFKEPGEI